MIQRTGRRGRQSGQIVVVLAVGLIALVVGVGLVLDVGYAWSEQRATQNSADSAAKAGAVVLAQRAAEGTASTLTAAQWDERVRNAVLGAVALNGSALTSAEYTDYLGTPSGMAVGLGSIPANAAGVHVVANKSPGTYLVRVIGINEWQISQEAIAVSGPTLGCLETDTCQTLPITFPVQVYACAGNNKSELIDPPQAWIYGQELSLPICGGNPGSVGWIDWTPTEGGTSELVDAVLHPPDYPITLPSWHYITETGGISTAGLEAAINTYAGEIVQVPMFDSTCAETPTNPLTSGCADPGGMGQNQWYHIVRFLSFRLADPRGAYLQGGETNVPICGNNAQQCLRGTFVTFITEGTVLPPSPEDPGEQDYAVQLIK
jgi:hypothetical protein